MPKHAGPPLRKVTLNLYEEDCAKAEVLLGWGWTEQLREMFHEGMNKATKRTVEDIGRNEDG